MLNFTVGPVQMNEEVRNIGSEQIPYFRTAEFSKLMIENEELIKKLFFAGDNSKAVFMTGSGTASMEAAVMNVFDETDKVLVVNGGSFGERFVQLCQIHNVNYTEIKLETSTSLTKQDLEQYEGKGYNGFLINAHETSTGVLYDMRMVSDFCKRNNILLIVDAISAFLADEIHMEELGISVMITGSQKALALPPGVSVIVMDEKAIARVESNTVKSMYFDLKNCLKNAERGQTPFTPAVGTLIQLNKRLKMIDEEGFEGEHNKIASIAKDFREKIKELPFVIASQSLSNAVTPISHTGGVSGHKIFEILKDEYNIFVCPNGGELKDKIVRIGHIGALTISDNDALIDALKDMKKRGII